VSQILSAGAFSSFERHYTCVSSTVWREPFSGYLGRSSFLEPSRIMKPGEEHSNFEVA